MASESDGPDKFFIYGEGVFILVIEVKLLESLDALVTKFLADFIVDSISEAMVEGIEERVLARGQFPVGHLAIILLDLVEGRVVFVLDREAYFLAVVDSVIYVLSPSLLEHE